MGNNNAEVAVRFAVKDAEVVRQALKALGKDGEDALKRFDTNAKPASKSLTAVGDTVNEVKGRAAGLAGGLGLLGTALLGLGPVGLVVGAALGAVYLAMRQATEAAHNLATSGQELRSFASVTGLTLNQAAAVSKLGVQFGIGGDQVRTFIEKFTTGMEEVRRAEGPIFEAVSRINPQLALQMAASKDTADALNLLARAYQEAGEKGDKFLQARLARAAGGRGGAETAQVLGVIADRGGVQQIAKEAEAAGKAIDEQLITRLAKLKAEIEETTKRAERISASIFAEELLEKELRWAQYLERAAIAAKGLADSKDRLAAHQSAGIAAAGASVFSGVEPNLAEIGQQDLREGLREAALQEARRKLRKGNADLSNVYGGMWAPTPEAAASASGSVSGGGPIRLSAEAQLNIFQRQITALGEAATPAEQLKLRILQLAAAQEKHGVSNETATRALEAFKKKQEETAVSTRERLGIATEQEIRTVELRKVDDDYTRGYVRNAAERATADKIAAKDARDRAQAVEVRASDFPQLTRLRQEAGDFQKELDTGLSGSLRGVTSDIVAMAKGTETASQGFLNMGQRIADAVLQAALMKSVVGPAAGGLSSVLGSLFGGNPSVAGAPGVVGSAGSIAVPTFPSANGNVFSGLGGIRNSIVDRPILIPMARGGALIGEAGPEAVIPLRRGSGGRLGVDASGMGGGLNVNHTVNNYAGVEVSNTSQQRGTDIDITTVIRPLAAALADDQMRGRGPLSRLNPRPPLRG